MKARNEIPEEVRQYLAMIIAEDADRNSDHIRWLESHPNEPDCEQQRAECERAVEMARRAQAFFPAPPEPDDPAEGATPDQAARR